MVTTTIKKRMIATNILMLVVPVVLCIVAGFLLRVILFYVFEARGLPFPGKVEPDPERYAMEPWMYLYFLGQMVLITGIFFASNMFFTRRIAGMIMAEHESYENNRRELIAGISHDLRTPLTSIKAYLEGLETGVASTPEKRQQYFATIKAKSTDLEHIINQLFLFSKLDIGEYPMTMQKLDLAEAFSEMLGELTDEYARRGLIIEQKGFAEKMPVNADYVQLRNVILNVLENSVKYKTEGQGNMTISGMISGEAKGAAAKITLTDDGPGVPPEALDKLFDVFYRTDPARNNEKKGSGLGLAIADKTIRRMGGTIHAQLPESARARGLSIVIQLPIVQERG
ncbi:MAG: hypothetical protein Ta2A_14410 [Treponemataceae bacterium]|nr:MAG: hypothetical protein Ta2A_14410 [Treponemataceae bacterium]